ncbi:hypothetical protein EKD04_022260 [Chloroflexales bacterium ZM16-3]|nr:hypothetical protein [Chloroflexales bacterium ZM16-3]
MSAPSVSGPIEQITLADGGLAPWYMIKFDATGRCVSQKSRAHLVQAVRAGKASHILIFSHGWNNAWDEVYSLTGNFFKSFAGINPVPTPGGQLFRPIFVSVYWPSIALTLESERGPKLAAGGVPTMSDKRAVAFVAEALPADNRRRVRELAARAQLSRPELYELAQMLAPLFGHPDEEQGVHSPPEARQLEQFWRASAARLASGVPRLDFGFGDDDDDDHDHDLRALDPQPAAGELIDWVRLPYRIATVWRMKDRAGVVGAGGVGRLLRELLDSPASTRVHLIGHSYGCRVMLSALCAEAPPRAVESVLLLQPAISRLCFAAEITGTGRPGGYHGALKLVRQPIITTYSNEDWPLHEFFHIAVRRLDDLGELRIAGGPPSRYAALGGYGPGGVGDNGVQREVPHARGLDYNLVPDGPRILAVDGTAAQKPDGSSVIAGHGDVSSLFTWWMLYSQVAAS